MGLALRWVFAAVASRVPRAHARGPSMSTVTVYSVRDPGGLLLVRIDPKDSTMAEIESARSAWIRGERPASCLDAGALQGVCGVHRLPGRGAVLTRKESACAKPCVSGWV